LIPAAGLAAAALALAGQTAPVPRVAPREARDKAIAALHARAAFALPGSKEASRVAEDLQRLGEAYLAEGETGRAAELLTEAYALDEENGLALAELTLCHLRTEDLDGARFYLRLAEERVSRAPPEIYAALGDAYLGLHRLDDAVFAWEEFLRFGGTDPALVARLSRARQELAVSRGQRQLSSEHFQIFADTGVADETVRQVGADLETAASSLGDSLGRRLPARQVVVLYSGRSYFSLVSVPEWSSGLYDGKIRVSVERGSSPEALSAVLIHELAHALVRQAGGDRAPAWFHEGVAQWCEGRRLPVREIRSVVNGSAAASPEALDRAFGQRLARSAARASYAQALSLVEYLVAERGTGALACLLASLSEEGRSFDEALLSEAGLSEGELFRAWKKWAGL
jgi:tetratricopeptide (TPR) repeat protein